MKKLMGLLTALFLIINSFGINVLAETNLNESDGNVYLEENLDGTGMKSVKITRYDNNSNSHSNAQPSITIELIQDNGTVYYSERIDNEMKVYENGEYLGSILYNDPKLRSVVPQFNDSERYLNFSAGTGFSNFGLSDYNTWSIQRIQDYVGSQITTLLINGILGGLPFYVIGMYNAISSYSSGLSLLLATGEYYQAIADGSYHAATVTYGSYHKDCNILAWYGIKNFTMLDPQRGTIDRKKGFSDFIKNGKHIWNGNPDDMTQPYGCRVVVKDYPA